LSSEDQSEEVYREILEAALKGVEKAEELLESGNEATVKFALKYLSIMSDYAVAMAQLLEGGTVVVEAGNPLARRVRVDR
jgi:hypothetical protein